MMGTPYPSYPQLTSSVLTRDTGIVMDPMQSGKVRGSDGYDTVRNNLELHHFLTAAELSSLIALEESNRGQYFDVVYDADPDSATMEMIIVTINYTWHASTKYLVTVELTGGLP